MPSGCSTIRASISRSRRAGREPGLDHLGIQVESADELQEVYARLRQAGGAILEAGANTCCYAKSEKSWIDDPAGISWETFHTTGESHALRHQRQGGRTDRPREGLLRAAAGHRGGNLPPPAAGREPWPSVPSTRCFSAPAIRRARSWPKRSSTSSARENSAPTRPAASRKGRSIRTPSRCCKGSATTPRAFARNRGASLPSPARRRSISCSPSATTRRARPARSGRASR